ncbi:MAG: class I SAM-dependent methyltransferase [Bacteroidetes bacterium]|nr:class I SAM-dependent methyltransferase [Bacteroidota bacterium]
MKKFPDGVELRPLFHIFTAMASKFNSFLYEIFGFTSRFRSHPARFMNLGTDGKNNFGLRGQDEKDEPHIRLYAALLDLVPGIKDGKINSVLEIGCGRGGGCYVMEKYFGLKNISGMDKSRNNIHLAKRLECDHVNFFTGDANDFSFENKFDLVVNLESSHAYKSRKKFFLDVAPIMSENSYLAFGDVMRKEKRKDIEQGLSEAGLELISSREITAGVARCISEKSASRFPFATKYPRLVPFGLHNFFVTKHSHIFRNLQDGKVVYMLYSLKKKKHPA